MATSSTIGVSTRWWLKFLPILVFFSYNILYKNTRALQSIQSAVMYGFVYADEFETNNNNNNNQTVLFHEDDVIPRRVAVVGDEQNRYPFTFSGCLLLKDDNQILPEWLAYHYTTLPLRHLIVAVDPLSKTTPQWILDEYKNTLGMNITTWVGHWYFQDGGRDRIMSEYDPKTATHDHTHQMHRQRQISFYTACMKEHQQQNRTWTVLIDTDEYLTYNVYSPSESNHTGITNREKCHLSTQLEGKKAEICEIQAQLQNNNHTRSYVPQHVGRQNETIAHWIASDIDRFVSDTYQKHPCVVLPRVWYGAKPTSNPIVNASVPSSAVDPYAFHTIPYIRHGPKRTLQPGKSLMNAKYYTNKFVHNPHRPLQDDCDDLGGGKAFADVLNHTLRVHHYTGTRETFYSRLGRDPRWWDKRNDYDVEDEDTSMDIWFHEFVKLLDGNISHAKYLTQDLRAMAYNESMQIIDQYNKNASSVRPYREWDDWAQ